MLLGLAGPPEVTFTDVRICALCHLPITASEQSTVPGDSAKSGCITIIVVAENHTDHKLPTGFPGRRLWLRFTVCDAARRTLFESGAWDESAGEIRGFAKLVPGLYQVTVEALFQSVKTSQVSILPDREFRQLWKRHGAPVRIAQATTVIPNRRAAEASPAE